MTRWSANLLFCVCAACAAATPEPASQVITIAPPPAATRAPGQRVEDPGAGPVPAAAAPSADAERRVDLFAAAAALSAIDAVDVSPCATSSSPSGPGYVNVVLDPNGVVPSARLDQGPLAGTAAGRCIERMYEAVTFPPFSGAPIRVAKSFVLP
jgi:hypothetical protein